MTTASNRGSRYHCSTLYYYIRPSFTKLGHVSYSYLHKSSKRRPPSNSWAPFKQTLTPNIEQQKGDGAGTRKKKRERFKDDGRLLIQPIGVESTWDLIHGRLPSG